MSEFQSLSPSLTDFTTVIVISINKSRKQKIGPPADTVIVTSSGIIVLHAELASVRALLFKGLYHSNLPSTLELVCDVPSLLHENTQTKFRKCKYKFSRTHIDVAFRVLRTMS